jgi:hypothetical protein
MPVPSGSRRAVVTACEEVIFAGGDGGLCDQSRRRASPDRERPVP